MSNSSPKHTPEQIASRADNQASFLDKLLDVLRLKNDAALSRKMGVQPPVISKLRSGLIPFGASYIIIVHELTGWSIKQIKADLKVA